MKASVNPTHGFARSDLAAMAMMSFSSLLLTALWSTGHQWGGDFAAYIMQAMSVVDRTTAEFVRQNAFTINESTVQIGPVAYPWGFPLLLAPVYAAFGLDLAAFKAVGLVLHLLFLATLWLGFSRTLGPAERLVFVGLFAFNPTMLEFGDEVLSDIPFLFFSTLSLAMLARLHCGEPERAEESLAFRLALGLAIGAAFLVRTNGVLLLLVYLGMTLLDAWRRRDRYSATSLQASGVVRQLAPLASFVALVGPVLWWLPGGQESHLADLAGVNASTLRSNLVYYGWLVGDFFNVLPAHPRVGLSLYLLSIPVLVLGLWSHWRAALPLILYALATLGLFVLWPYQQGLRFLFPVLPVYVYFLILGFRTAASFSAPLRRRAMWPLAAVALGFASIASASAVSNIERGRPPPSGPYVDTATEMFDFIRMNAAGDDVVVFWKPRVMRLFTGRPSVMYRRADEVRHGEFIVIDKQRARSRPMAADGAPDAYGPPGRERRAVPVFENADFEVVRLTR